MDFQFDVKRGKWGRVRKEPFPKPTFFKLIEYPFMLVSCYYNKFLNQYYCKCLDKKNRSKLK